MIGSTLLRYKTDQIYMCFDTETEGLNLGFSRPWEIAWTVFRDNEIIERASHFIKWDDLYVSPDAARVSHYSPKEYLEKAEDARVILDKFEKHLYNPDYKIVGHNLFFDSYVHTNWRRNLGLGSDYSWMDRHIDTNVLAKAYKKNWMPDTKNYSQWQWRVNNYREKGLKTNMGQMCKELNIEFREDKAHRASYDVDRNIALWNDLKWKVEV